MLTFARIALFTAVAAAGPAGLAAAQPTASAEGGPVPWEITGTSTVPLPRVAPTHRVQARRFAKSGRTIVRAGLSYLTRGDFYTSPGVSAEISWYPAEYLAVDLVSATLFFSSLTSTADALRKSTGLLPDSQRPVAWLTAGARLSFAYGKLLIELLDTVVHLDASVAAHLGTMITDETPNIGGDLGLAFQVLAAERAVVWMEVSWLASYERRSNAGLVGGPRGTIGVGLRL